MKTLKTTVTEAGKTIYIYAEDTAAAKQFLQNAESEGFMWSDGRRPTQNHISDFYAVHTDTTINYIGAAGRTAFQCSSGNILKLNYEDFISKNITQTDKV